MPFASNEEVRIHYEVDGHGPALITAHGLMGSGADWRLLGYSQALREDYRLIMVDVRGCGESDRFYEPECYRSELIAADFAAVLNDLGIEAAHFLGYSMGGNIGFCCMARHASERCRSLVLGGADGAYRTEASAQFVGQMRGLVQMAADRGMVAYVALWEQLEGPLPDERKAQMLAVDPHARLALFNAYPLWRTVEDILPSVAVPALIYAGDHDPAHAGAQECAAHMPDARFVTLPGLNHSQGLYQIAAALPHIRKFLRKQ